MRDLLVGGTRVMTTDDVADALLDYVLELNAHHTTAVAAFPALVEGRAAHARMVVGAGIPLMTVTVEWELPLTVEGADFAAWEIRERTAILAGHTTPVEWESQEPT